MRNPFTLAMDILPLSTLPFLIHVQPPFLIMRYYLFRLMGGFKCLYVVEIAPWLLRDIVCLTASIFDLSFDFGSIQFFFSSNPPPESCVISYSTNTVSRSKNQIGQHHHASNSSDAQSGHDSSPMLGTEMRRLEIG